MTGHTRALTYPALIGLLQDGRWHAHDEINALTFFPREWLNEIEREGHELERRGPEPELIRLVA